MTPRGERQRRRACEPTISVPIKMTADQRRRFRVAAAEDDVTYAQLIIDLLDERDAKHHRLKRAQAHPFHRPAEAGISP
jgi:hypothetical protein